MNGISVHNPRSSDMDTAKRRKKRDKEYTFVPFCPPESHRKALQKVAEITLPRNGTKKVLARTRQPFRARFPAPETHRSLVRTREVDKKAPRWEAFFGPISSKLNKATKKKIPRRGPEAQQHLGNKR